MKYIINNKEVSKKEFIKEIDRIIIDVMANEQTEPDQEIFPTDYLIDALEEMKIWEPKLNGPRTIIYEDKTLKILGN